MSVSLFMKVALVHTKVVTDLRCITEDILGKVK